MTYEELVSIIEQEKSIAHNKFLETYALDVEDDRDYWDIREQAFAELLKIIQEKETANA